MTVIYKCSGGKVSLQQDVWMNLCFCNVLLLNVYLSKVWPVSFFEAGELREDILGQLVKNMGSSINGCLLQQLCFLIASWQGMVYTGLLCCVWLFFSFFFGAS